MIAGQAQYGILETMSSCKEEEEEEVEEEEEEEVTFDWIQRSSQINKED